MDMSLVMSALSAKAGAAQMQIATALLKNNADAERAMVQTLLGGGQPAADPLANVASGVGGNVDVSA